MKKGTLRALAILSVVSLLTLVGCTTTGGFFTCLGGCFGDFFEKMGCAVEMVLFPTSCMSNAICGCDCNAISESCYCTAEDTRYSCNQQDVKNMESSLLAEVQVTKQQFYELEVTDQEVVVDDSALQNALYIQVLDSSNEFLGCGFEVWKKTYTFTLTNNSNCVLKDVYLCIGPKTDEKICYIGNIDAHSSGAATVFEYSDTPVFGKAATSYDPDSGTKTMVYFYGSYELTEPVETTGCGG